VAQRLKEFRVEEQSLNTVAAGLSLAQHTVSALRNGEDVRIDLCAAERMTPSFANALVMTILMAVGEREFSDRVRLSASSGLVLEAWAKAVERYRRGIRLSTQQPGAA
jgi:hypothetical protein